MADEVKPLTAEEEAKLRELLGPAAEGRAAHDGLPRRGQRRLLATLDVERAARKAAEERIRVLEEALEPFARYSEHIPPTYADDWSEISRGRDAQLAAADFRRALAARRGT